MTIRSLGLPWASPGDRQYSLPTSLILKVSLGEAPDDIPAIRDVGRRVLPAATRIDGGPIDRIVGMRAGGMQAARLHAAAANAINQGKCHCGYDGIEQMTGMARTIVIRVPAGTPIGPLCDTLAQISTVESASPNYVCTTPFDSEQIPIDPGSEDAWTPRRMVGMADALAYEPGDPSILVGLIDSGIAPSHEETAHALRAGYDTVRLESGDVAPGIKLLGDHRKNDSNPEDRFVGHGMGCAGIIAAAGLRMPAGLGGACRIIPMRALGAAQLPGRALPVGLGALSDLDMAMKLAIDLGAKVINMSFGTDDSALASSAPKPHADVIAYAMARGCILVAASGNNGGETRYWPAAYPDVIAVGAVGMDGRPTAFSTRGDHVALCAPGEGVLTAGISGYQLATGTSFAAPFVTAAIALLVSRAARRAVPVDAAMARDILIQSARPFGRGHQQGCGAGILDAAAALRLLDARIDATLSDQGGADDG